MKPSNILIKYSALMISLMMAGIFTPASAQELSLDLGEDFALSGQIVQILVLMTVLSLAPAILVVITSFTRIIIVFSLLRSAMGTQQTPPNVVLISLALFMTAFIMAPTIEEAYEQGVSPLMDEIITEDEAYERITTPFHTFMMSQVREKDLQLFVDLSRSEIPEQQSDTPIQVLIPAFIISELRRAFEIGFLIFIPFIIIDMIVASILMSMGMMMLPPVLISLPFKLIFFVMVDGWHLLVGSLIQSFGPGGVPPGV